MLALNGRRVAIGYAKGLQVINIDSEEVEIERENVAVGSMTRVDDDTLCICDTRRKLFLYSLSADNFKSVSFATRKTTSKTRSMAVDTEGRIYVGSKELKCIDVFQQSGGQAVQEIKTNVKPWFISVTKNGYIAVTECKKGIEDAIQILTSDGKDVCRIPGKDDRSPLLACDQQENIYLALQADDGQTRITKYSVQGDFLEVVTENLQMSLEPRRWMQLCCVSPSDFVACDTTAMYVFCRRPSLSELTSMMN